MPGLKPIQLLIPLGCRPSVRSSRGQCSNRPGNTANSNRSALPLRRWDLGPCRYLAVRSLQIDILRIPVVVTH